MCISPLRPLYDDKDKLIHHLRGRCRELYDAISNVMTDDQLDTPVPALKGRTTREMLRGEKK